MGLRGRVGAGLAATRKQRRRILHDRRRAVPRGPRLTGPRRLCVPVCFATKCRGMFFTTYLLLRHVQLFSTAMTGIPGMYTCRFSQNSFLLLPLSPCPVVQYCNFRVLVQYFCHHAEFYHTDVPHVQIVQ